MRCPSCGAWSEKGSSTCPSCGYLLGQALAPEHDVFAQPSRYRRPIMAKSIALVVLVLLVSLSLVVWIFYFTSIDLDGTPTGPGPSAVYSHTSVYHGEHVNIVAITKTDVSWDDITVQLSDSTNFWDWAISADLLDDGTVVTHYFGLRTSGGIEITLNLTDLQGNGVVSAGDYFVLTSSALSSVTTYRAGLIHEPTGEYIGTGVYFTGQVGS